MQTDGDWDMDTDAGTGAVSVGVGVAMLVTLLILGPEWCWTIAAFGAGVLVMAGLWMASPRR